MYHSYKYCIRPGNPHYDYFSRITQQANNMYNVALFTQRQVMTGLKKDPDKRTKNECETLELLEKTLPKMKPKYTMPTAERPWLSYNFLCNYMTCSRNVDFYAQGFPAQIAQNMIRLAVRDMTSFFQLKKKYIKDPSSLLGAPKLPHYKSKGGHCTVLLSNQTCRIQSSDKGRFLQLTLCEIPFYGIDFIPESYTLQQASIVPYHDVFQFILTMDDGKAEVRKNTPAPSRICTIDLGVSNFAAVSNNAGLPGLLFKGGIIKSINRWYNKETGHLQSEQTKGTTERFVMTPRTHHIALRRDHIIDDFMHKAAKRIVQWCRKNELDTIVIGSNALWKQNIHIGKKSTQNFVQIPYNRFKQILSYLCERSGLYYFETEESYTSKASFVFQDPIPVYRKDDPQHYSFSGKRGPCCYHGQKKESGFRGLYQNKDGSIVNADLNGSANIGRKLFPELFPENAVCFDRTIVIIHPDQLKM